jgi:hypothetical protein
MSNEIKKIIERENFAILHARIGKVWNAKLIIIVASHDNDTLCAVRQVLNEVELDFLVWFVIYFLCTHTKATNQAQSLLFNISAMSSGVKTLPPSSVCERKKKKFYCKEKASRQSFWHTILMAC